jgi:two-component system sensor kinase FixL
MSAQWESMAAPGEGASRPAPNIPLITAAFLVFAAYFIGAKVGLALTFQPNPISVLWPPNAILLAALVLAPVQWWWALLAAALPAHLLAELQGGVPVSMVLCWFVSNASEALIGAACLRRLAPAPRTFDSLPNVAGFVACAALLGPFLSSFLDAAFVTLVGWGQGSYWDLWRTRFFSNVLATLAIVPLIVTFAAGGPAWWRSSTPGLRLEAAVLFAGLLAAGVFAFDLPAAVTGLPAGLLYLPLPFLLWAALRFGPPGASAAFTLVAFLVIWGAAHGQGPFTAGTPAANALSVQLFLVIVGITQLAVAAVVQERRRAELSLRRSEECFSTAFRCSPDAMVINRKSDGRIIEVNERCLAMFGRARGEVIGRTAQELEFFVSDAERLKFSALAAEGRARELELEFRVGNGGILLAAVSSQAAEVAGEACLVTIIRDVSDRKLAQEANDRLAHVSRLAVMGELTASIAHEINQPLGAILSNADAAELLLRADPVPVEELRQILDDIRKDDLRASDVMRHMRSLLRRRELEKHPLDLNRTVGDVLELVRADLERRRVSLATEFAPLPAVHGDAVHLQQVVLNLVLNGVDAMAEMPPPRRRIEIRTARADAGGVEVSVSDLGPGIAPEQAERLFQSFYTTKKEGMGLGLAIARSIVEAHGGRIWAESRPRGGTRFRFILPAGKEMLHG